METVFFHRNTNLPEFASYDLLRSEDDYQTLDEYYKSYIELAQRFNIGLVFQTPTWRVYPDWGLKIGDSLDALHHFNLKAVKQIKQIAVCCI